MGRLRLYTDEERIVRRKLAVKKYSDNNLGYSRDWAIKNPIKKANSDRNWYLKNKEKVCERIKTWQEFNKDKVRCYQLKYQTNRIKEDIPYRLARRLRQRVWKSLKYGKKPSSIIGELGCSLDELKTYLEKRFTEGMNWENYGKWHIDHIRPLSSFDLTNKDEFKIACHHTNLQPLWAVDNILKSNKIGKIYASQ